MNVRFLHGGEVAGKSDLALIPNREIAQSALRESGDGSCRAVTRLY